jgi:hypothetical protein
MFQSNKSTATVSHHSPCSPVDPRQRRRLNPTASSGAAAVLPLSPRGCKHLATDLEEGEGIRYPGLSPRGTPGSVEKGEGATIADPFGRPCARRIAAASSRSPQPDVALSIAIATLPSLGLSARTFSLSLRSASAALMAVGASRHRRRRRPPSPVRHYSR